MFVSLYLSIDWQNLATENEELLSKMEMLKQELRDGKGEIEKTTDDYLKLKV